MFTIDHRDGRPIFEQVRDSLRTMILTGVMAPGDKMPSVRSLAMDLAINPNTIQRAYRELETEGYIYSSAGLGSFVAERTGLEDPRRKELLEQFDALCRELYLTGETPESLAERLEQGGKSSD